jgi:hypothetical protein
MTTITLTNKQLASLNHLLTFLAQDSEDEIIQYDLKIVSEIFKPTAKKPDRMTTPKYKIMTIEKYQKLMECYMLNYCAGCDWKIENHPSFYAGGYDNEMCQMREACGKHFCINCSKTKMKIFENPVIDGETDECGHYCLECVEKNKITEEDDEDNKDDEDDEDE